MDADEDTMREFMDAIVIRRRCRPYSAPPRVKQPAPQVLRIDRLERFIVQTVKK
jgi:hypothetical protein